jgi:hypothetical protein
MSVTITIKDQRTGGGATQWELELAEERMTVRDLIRSRVFQEVKDYNARLPATFRGLVQPTDAEQTLNGFKLPKGKRIDWNPQFDRALEAFRENGFILLVDDHQVESLDEEVTLTSETEVTFLKLVPLVGG